MSTRGLRDGNNLVMSAELIFYFWNPIVISQVTRIYVHSQRDRKRSKECVHHKTPCVKSGMSHSEPESEIPCLRWTGQQAEGGSIRKAALRKNTPSVERGKHSKTSRVYISLP